MVPPGAQQPTPFFCLDWCLRHVAWVLSTIYMPRQSTRGSIENLVARTSTDWILAKQVNSGCWNRGLTRPKVPLNTLQSTTCVWGKVFRLISGSRAINSMSLVSVDSLTLASVLRGAWWIVLKIWTSNWLVNFCGNMCFNGTGTEVSTLCKPCSKHEHSAPRSKNIDAPHKATSSQCSKRSSIRKFCLISLSGSSSVKCAKMNANVMAKPSIVDHSRLPCSGKGILWFHQPKIKIIFVDDAQFVDCGITSATIGHVYMKTAKMHFHSVLLARVQAVPFQELRKSWIRWSNHQETFPRVSCNVITSRQNWLTEYFQAFGEGLVINAYSGSSLSSWFQTWCCLAALFKLQPCLC